MRGKENQQFAVVWDVVKVGTKAGLARKWQPTKPTKEETFFPPVHH